MCWPSPNVDLIRRKAAFRRLFDCELYSAFTLVAEIDCNLKRFAPIWELETTCECAMRSQIEKFWRDETAATAIEYGLIAAGVALAIITVVYGLGTKLKGTFTNISSQLK
jgi:pilus assembly protein Flp/PilA